MELREKEDTLQTHGKDKYLSRTCRCAPPDGGDHVNHALVKDGWCWWYQKYVCRDT